MANDAFDPRGKLPEYLTFAGNPVNDKQALVKRAREIGMSDEKIYHMLGSLWKTPTPPAPPAWQGPGSGSGVATGAPLFPSSDKLCMMIAMRMRWPEGRTLPMSYLSAHQTEDTVFVFMVHNKQAVVIEDEAIMFPSDALITKLRLMLG